MSRDTQEENRWPTRRLGDVLVRHNEVIHPGERTGEATFVGLEHIEPNSGRRVGSLTIDLGSLTGGSRLSAVVRSSIDICGRT